MFFFLFSNIFASADTVDEAKETYVKNQLDLDTNDNADVESAKPSAAEAKAAEAAEAEKGDQGEEDEEANPNHDEKEEEHSPSAPEGSPRSQSRDEQMNQV